MSDARDLIGQIRQRRHMLWLAGRDPQGVAHTPPEQSETWIVTQVDPVLMASPVGGHAVSVEATDGVKGVRVGHRVRVEVRGMGSRVAVALLDQLPIKARDSGEDVATINGKTVTVGGSTVLSADDVGALPGDTTLADLGYTGVPSHSHTVGSTNCTITLPSVSPSWFTSNLSDPQATINADFNIKLDRLLAAVNTLSSASRSCSGCGASGSTGSSGGGGGSPTPTNPGQRSIVISASDPSWFEPGSPDAWSWSWGADIWTLTKRAASTLSYLSGRTYAATGGSGSITLRTITPIDTSEPVPWEQYSQVWGDQMHTMIAECYAAYAQIVGSYSVSGGGSVTLGPSAPSNPAQSPPVHYTQAYGASVRLALSRLHSALRDLCGASFPY